MEAFALFNVFYQGGIMTGPLVGLALIALDFRLVCTVAALLFLGLTLVQLRALPENRETLPRQAGILANWRIVVTNRPFLLFSAAMIGSSVLSFQIYLALPLQAHRAAPGHGDAVTTVLFAISAGIAAVGQLRVTAWARARWSPRQSIVHGLTLMGASFAPLLLAVPVPHGTGMISRALALAPLFLATGLLALGAALVYPFEMDTVVSLSGDRLVATHYGLYSTVSGLGITLGNFATGAVWDISTTQPRLPWLLLTAVGAACAVAVAALARTGRLRSPEAPAPQPATAG